MRAALAIDIAGASSPTAKRFATTISILTVLLTLLVWCCVGLMQFQARQRTAEQARQAMLNVVLELEHDIERTISTYDLSLQATQRALRLPGIDRLPAPVRSAVLFDGSTEADDLAGVLVLDAAGRIVEHSKPIDQNDQPLADRDYFRAQLSNRASDLFISAPYRNRPAGDLSIALSRRLSNPDGSFAGVVAGAIRLGYFRTMFARLDLGPGAVFRLQTLSGDLILREPEAAEPARTSNPTEAALSRMGPSASLAVTAVSQTDGMERLFTFHRVGSFPLVLGVGVATTQLYAEWWRETIAILAFVVLLTGVAALLGVRLRAELARRRASEERVRQAAARLAMLTDHASDIIQHVSGDGGRPFVSSACERILGISPADFAARSWLELVHPDDAPILSAAFRATRAGQDVGLIAYRMKAGDGGYRQVEANCRALPDGDGVIFVIRDVTERTRLEGRLHQSQRMEAIGQLTAGVAHDFNNMLQAQLSRLETLSDEVADRPAALQLVDQAIEMAGRGARMTHQLLSFSRQQVLRPEAVSLAATLPSLAALFQQMLGVRIRVASEIAAGTPPVLVDGAYLEAALLNLALNARDAMPEGGHLAFAAGPAEAAARPPELDPQGDYVVLAVSDDGKGMDEATLARACEPFFTTKGLNGTGLGLASVQGFVRQSGGDLRIASTAGMGTRIEIWLPVAASTVRAEMRPARERAAQTARILLVDDESGVRDAVAECLEAAGFRLEAAVDAEAALDVLAERGRFDALVTDFMLPGMDGAELVAQARRMCPGIATLVITGGAAADGLRDLPPDTAVLHKPFRREDLIERVKRALDGAAPLAAGSADLAAD